MPVHKLASRADDDRAQVAVRKLIWRLGLN
jgi:hypothetical protein